MSFSPRQREQYEERINGRLSQGDGVTVKLNGRSREALYSRAIEGRKHRCVIAYADGHRNKDGNPRMKFKTVATAKVHT